MSPLCIFCFHHPCFVWKNIFVFNIPFFIAPQSCFIHLAWSYFYIFTLLHYALHTLCTLSCFCILTSLHCAFHTQCVLSYFCIFTPLHWFCIFIFHHVSLMVRLHSIVVLHLHILSCFINGCTTFYHGFASSHSIMFHWCLHYILLWFCIFTFHHV